MSATSSSNDAGTFSGKGQAFVGLANGGALAGYGTSGTAASPVISAQANVSGTDIFAAYNYAGVNGNTTSSAGSALKTAYISGQSLNRGGGGIPGASDLQISGDIFVYGRIFQDCSSFPVTSSSICSDIPLQTATTTIASPSRHGNVSMYSARQTLPSVEDFGTGRLAGGRAYVPLDPAFADTIATTQPYMVIVTPDGESHGVYVSNRTLRGFEVHENDAGRSTVDFDYRVVARPIGDTSVRLASVVPRQKFGASRAAFSLPDPHAMSRPVIRRPPPIDPSFVRASASLESQRERAEH